MSRTDMAMRLARVGEGARPEALRQAMIAYIIEAGAPKSVAEPTTLAFLVLARGLVDGEYVRKVVGEGSQRVQPSRECFGVSRSGAVPNPGSERSELMDRAPHRARGKRRT